MSTFNFNEMVEVTLAKLADPPDLNPERIEAHVREAVTTYSLHRPLEKTVELPGDGGFDYDLPADFMDRFSVIRELVFPFDGESQDLPRLVEGKDFLVYRTPTGLQLRFIAEKPTAAEVFRLTYALSHEVSVSSSTIAEPDARAVCNLAAGLLAESLAAEFERKTRSTLPDITLDLRSKAQDLQRQADRFYRRYREYMGIPEDGRPLAASSEMDTDWLPSPQFGRPLTHPTSAQ